MQSEQNRHFWNTTSSGEYVKSIHASSYNQVNVDNKGNLCGDIWMKRLFETVEHLENAP